MEEARRWRKIEREERGVEEVPRVVEEMEEEGAHPLHHSVIALKQEYLEARCQGELDKVTSHSPPTQASLSIFSAATLVSLTP